MKTDSAFGRIGDVLSDETSLRLLGILSKGPQFVKNIAILMEKPESRISEKISSLRKLGMIDYRWKRTNGRNVKEYFLTTKKIEISFSSGRPTILFKGKDSSSVIHVPEFIDFSPPRVKRFVGRKKELTILEEKSKVFISGISGIGKTSLVARYVMRTNRPVFWHTVREADSLDYMLMKMSSFLDSIGRNNLSRMITINASKRMIMDYCISELRKTKSIIVIDDFQLCRDKNISGFIDDISLSEPSLKIVLISKGNTPPTNGYHIINLGGLSYEESRLLLLNSGKKHDAQTISSLGGYPLALSLMGKISEEEVTIETLASTLADKIREDLSNPEREVLLLAAAFREAFTPQELNFVMEREARGELDVLVSKGLISSRARTYYVHEFVRDVAASLQSDQRSIHERLGQYYASYPNPMSTIEAIYHFGKSGNSDSLVKLIKENAAVLADSGFSEPLLSVLDLLAKSKNDPIARGWILLWMAKIEQMKGNYSLAEDLSEEIIRTSGGRDEELNIRANLWLGQTFNALGRNEESLKILQKSLSLLKRKFNKEDLEADILLSLEWTLADLGKLDQAQSVLSRAIAIYEKIGERRNYFSAIFYRGYNNYLRGELSDAVKDMEDAYSGLFEMNRIISAAACLLHVAFAFWRQENSKNALLILNKSIQIYRDQNEELGEEHLRLSLCYSAIINAFSGKIDRAEKNLRELESFRRGKDDCLADVGEGLARGIINAQRKNWAVSDHNLALAEKAAEIYADRYFLCETKKWRGWMLMKRGSIDEAIRKFEELRAEASKFGLKIFEDDIERLIAGSELSPTVEPQS
jgi:tetratricopeptide (TPR) repeat protein